MATRYGRSVGGNWSAAGTWSASSGGGSDGAGLNAGDAVILDANSSPGTFNHDANFSIISLDCNGFTGTLTFGNFTFTISGNDAGAPTGVTLRLVPGMVFSPPGSRTFTFTSTSGTATLYFGGKTIPNVTFNGAGGSWVLGADITIATASVLTVTSGSFDTNNFNVTAGALNSTGAGVARAITLGTSTVTLTSTSGSLIEFASAGVNLTLSAASSTIIGSASATNVRTLNLGNAKTFGTITLINTGNNSYSVDFGPGTGGNTITSLNAIAPITMRITATSTLTVTNPIAWAGTGYNNAILLNSTPVSSGNVTLASGSTMDWFVVGNTSFTGSPVASNSFDLKGNSGISISPPGAVSGGTMVSEPGGAMTYNYENSNSTMSGATVITASTSKIAMIGQVWHPTRKTGTINIRKVHFRTSTLTLNAATEIRVSLQSVSTTAGPPYQPDGTQDQFYDFKTATTSLVASAPNVTGNLSADRVVDLAACDIGDANSQWLAVVWEFQAFNASDSFIVNCLVNASFRTGLGGLALLYTGAWATISGRTNNVLLECDDGTFAFLNTSPPNIITGSASVSSTAAIRRAGLKFSVPTARTIDRASLAVGVSNASDGRMVLYDGDGTTELASVDIDNDAVSSTQTSYMEVLFPPVTLLAGVFYRFVFVGTTTTTSFVPYFDVVSASHLDGMYLGQNAHWTQHNGTSWADTTTRQPFFGLGVSATHGGTASGIMPTYQIGI